MPEKLKNIVEYHLPFFVAPVAGRYQISCSGDIDGSAIICGKDKHGEVRGTRGSCLTQAKWTHEINTVVALEEGETFHVRILSGTPKTCEFTPLIATPVVELSDGPSLRRIQKECHEISASKGWWQDCPPKGSHWYPVYITSKTSLISCEVSEAIEEIRDGKELVYVKDGKPEGMGIELADAIIRALDMMEHLGLDAAELIAMKSAYNKTRPHRHGGKAL